jgi:membrane-associated phospholipid phosphatase
MFALASTLSRELGHQAPWVPYVAYSAAALTGVSRVVGKRHWVTDVLAGAAAGLFAGHFVGRLHGEEFIGLPITPILSAGDGGVYLGANIRFR